MSRGNGPTTTFVSYSHDSPSHRERVRQLSDRLRREGIDCQIDQYVMAPPEGWPRWMDHMIDESEFVLVVCTEVYYRRVSGEEASGVGLGAKWEGAIISQDIYEAEGMNEKFIPIVFSSDDLEFRPRFLRATTYYDVSNESGFEELYRRLTSQPRVIPPALGNVRRMRSPETSASAANETSETNDLVLIKTEEPTRIIAYELIEARARQTVTLRIAPMNPADSSLLLDLQRGHRPRVAIAYGSMAFLGSVLGVEQVVSKGIEEWTVELTEDASDYGAGMMEMGTSTYSADDLAEMRARRVLLNETLEETPIGGRSRMDQAFMELLLRGQSTPIQVEESPFPALWKQLQTNVSLFLSVGRLVGVMWLRLSGVVERIHRLDLSLLETGKLQVEFEGQRARKYTNVDPPLIRVSGVCRLE